MSFNTLIAQCLTIYPTQCIGTFSINMCCSFQHTLIEYYIAYIRRLIKRIFGSAHSSLLSDRSYTTIVFACIRYPYGATTPTAWSINPNKYLIATNIANGLEYSHIVDARCSLVIINKRPFVFMYIVLSRSICPWRFTLGSYFQLSVCCLRYRSYNDNLII